MTGEGRLAGRTILVVGAGTQPSDEDDPPVGNGRAIAVTAAREGAALVCADRDDKAADETAALVRAAGGSATVVLGDVRDERDCTALVSVTSQPVSRVSAPRLRPWRRNSRRSIPRTPAPARSRCFDSRVASVIGATPRPRRRQRGQ